MFYRYMTFLILGFSFHHSPSLWGFTKDSPAPVLICSTLDTSEGDVPRLAFECHANWDQGSNDLGEIRAGNEYEGCGSLMTDVC